MNVGAVELRLEVSGEVQIHRRLEGLLANIEDLTPALERIAEHFYAHMREVFATEGGATAGGRWTGLAPDYAAWKAQFYPGQGILQRTGRLRESLTAPGAAGSIREMDRQGMTLGSDVRVGQWSLGLIHQEGTRDGRLAPRRILDIPLEVRGEWMDIVREHVTAEGG